MFLNEKRRLLCDWFSVLSINTYMMLVVSNCLSNVINYIWFINIILNIMHISKIVVFFYCFEETCISTVISYSMQNAQLLLDCFHIPI